MQEQIDWMLPIDEEILSVLSESRLALSQKNIAININYDRSYVGKRVGLLVGAGLLEVENHRGSYYRITDFGVALLDEKLDPGILNNDEATELGQRVYQGKHDNCQTKVTVNGDALKPRPDIFPLNTSVEFEWGYIGGGPLHLSAALLADVLDDTTAKTRMNDFLHNVVKELDDHWELTAKEIQTYILSNKP